MLSLLMSSYNGQEYIEQQLESILKQSCPLDEVVIIDDKSTDATVEVVQRFIRLNALEKTWKIYTNEFNCGWKSNFINGVEKTNGEIVFFSDQDDIWHPDKVRLQKEIMENNSHINVVASRENLWYGGEYVFWDLIRDFDEIVIDKRCSHYRMEVSGCTMAFRRSFYDAIKPYYTEGQAHDEFLWQAAQITGSLAMLTDATILHRIHGNNESRKKRGAEERVNSCFLAIASMTHMISFLKKMDVDAGATHDKIALLNKRIDLVKARLSLLTNKNLLVVPKLIIDRYNIYYRKRQIIKDIFCAFGLIR